jgi:hypothetical protein
MVRASSSAMAAVKIKRGARAAIDARRNWGIG